jgi:hypothetical protein
VSKKYSRRERHTVLQRFSEIGSSLNRSLIRCGMTTKPTSRGRNPPGVFCVAYIYFQVYLWT